MPANCRTLGSGLVLDCDEDDAWAKVYSQLLDDCGTSRPQGGWGVKPREVGSTFDLDALCALYEHRLVRGVLGEVAGLAGFDHAWRDLTPLLVALSHAARPGSWYCVEDDGTNQARLFVLEGPGVVSETRGRESYDVAYDRFGDVPGDVLWFDDPACVRATLDELCDTYRDAGGVELVPAVSFQRLRPHTV